MRVMSCRVVSCRVVSCNCQFPPFPSRPALAPPRSFKIYICGPEFPEPSHVFYLFLFFLFTAFVEQQQCISYLEVGKYGIVSLVSRVYLPTRAVLPYSYIIQTEPSEPDRAVTGANRDQPRKKKKKKSTSHRWFSLPLALPCPCPPARSSRERADPFLMIVLGTLPT